MADYTQTISQPAQPHPTIRRLTERLSGKWQVKGHNIEGKAEYQTQKEGLLLVQNVDFAVDGTPIKVIQHIAYHQATKSLQAHYMDTMGNDSIYTWTLSGKKMRVSEGGKTSDTYFEATFNDENTEYSGIWHYPHGVDNNPIIYRRA